jgi:hypothetical protein
MKLIFVYNAKSGKINTVLDSLHKITSPETYNCNLCAITFGNFSENKTWKHFRESSDVEMVFYHKDEFLKEYQSKWLPKYEFPIILTETNNELEIVVTPIAINKLVNSEALVEEVKKYLLHY